MSMSQLPPSALASLHFDNTLGALLIGGLVAIALWGIACAQTYIYFERSSRDRPLFKLLVAFLWCLDTFDSCLNGHILYHYLVSNFINPLAIAVPVWSVVLHVFLTSLQDFIIRGMFARRIYRLSGGSIVLTAGIAALSLLDFICGTIITAKAFHVGTFTELNSISRLFYLNFAAGFSADAYVALTLCYFLHRSRTGFARTESLINVLMLYTINTGLLTAMDASIGMITYIVMPDNFIFIAFYLLLSKLYLNSYLAVLNAREGLREKAEGVVSIHLSRMSQSNRFVTDDVSHPSTAIEKQNHDRDPMAISVESVIKQESHDIEHGHYYAE